MAVIVTFSAGGAGVQHALAFDDDMIVFGDVELYSTDQSVITTNGGADITIGPNASILTFSEFGTRAAISLGESGVGGDSLKIASGALISAGNIGVQSFESITQVINRGDILANYHGVDLLGRQSSVTNFGTISGGNGIGVRVWGDGEIRNYGDVDAGLFALVLRDGDGLIYNAGTALGGTAAYLGGSGADEGPNRLINTGVLSGDKYGVYATSESAIITNTGTITSANPDLATVRMIDFLGEETFHMTNSGDILSAGFVFDGGNGVDTIINTGQMVGRMQLNAGDDIYRGQNGEVVGAIYGGDGDELVTTGAADNTIYGDQGNDTLTSNGGDDVLFGGLNDDRLRAGDGDDRVYGGEGADIMRGGDGADLLDGDTDSDLIYGGRGNDEIYAGSSADVVTAGDGDDTVDGGSSADMIRGGNGADDLSGGTGNDTVYGGAGNDKISGGNNTDHLKGGAGDDQLIGGSGGDTLNGGRDDDSLKGNGGADVFVFNRKAGDDVIVDFENGVDQIDLTAFGLRPADYAAIVQPAVSNPGGGAAFIDLAPLGGEGSILIEGLTFGNVDATDFIL